MLVAIIPVFISALSKVMDGTEAWKKKNGILLILFISFHCKQGDKATNTYESKGNWEIDNDEKSDGSD